MSFLSKLGGGAATPSKPVATKPAAPAPKPAAAKPVAAKPGIAGVTVAASAKKAPSIVAKKSAPVAEKPKGWMLMGPAAQKAIAKEDAKNEARKEMRGKSFRFFLKEGEEDVPITFLDGDLDTDGKLANPMAYEHTVKYNGRWENFACVGGGDAALCPLCAESSRDADLVMYFTVIDHREVVGQKRTYVHEVKLFPAKQGTLKQLQKLAAQHDGLTGLNMIVSRTGDKSPRVGDMFQPREKYDLESLSATFGSNEKGKEKVIAPLDYENEVVFLSPEKLKELGFGGPAGKVIGAEPKKVDVKKIAAKM